MKNPPKTTGKRRFLDKETEANVKKMRERPEDILVEIPDGLTEKQRAFVSEYVKDYNGQAAAIRAGYSYLAASSGRSTVILRIPSVRKAIDDYEKNLATRFIVTKERIMKELSINAFSEVNDFYMEDADGEIVMKPLSELPPQATRSIKKITTHRTVSKDGDVFTKTTFELHDKNFALNLMGKELAMFKDRAEFTGPDGKPLVPSPTVINVNFGDE